MKPTTNGVINTLRAWTAPSIIPICSHANHFRINTVTTSSAHARGTLMRGDVKVLPYFHAFSLFMM
jgi:hypothetical protein